MLNCNLDTKQALPNLLNINFEHILTSRLSVEEIVNYIHSSNETLQLVAIQNYKTLMRDRKRDRIRNRICISTDDIIEHDIVSRSIELLDTCHKYVFKN